jgi:hypothetical protein
VKTGILGGFLVVFGQKSRGFGESVSPVVLLKTSLK